MNIVKDLLGNEHRVRRCVVADIPVHFAIVSDIVEPEKHKLYQEQMEYCIDHNTAFCTDDNQAFIYYYNYAPCCANGVSLYGKGQPLKFYALLAEVFTTFDPRTFKLDFNMHDEAFIQEWKSLLTSWSMKRARWDNRPVCVRIDELRKKINNLKAKLKK